MKKLKRLKTYVSEMIENVKFKITCTIQANRVKRLYLKELKNDKSNTTGLGGLNSHQFRFGSDEDTELITHTNVIRQLILASKTMDIVYAKLTSAGYTDEQFISALYTLGRYDDPQARECREVITKAFQIMDAYKKTNFKQDKGELVSSNSIDDSFEHPFLSKEVLKY